MELLTIKFNCDQVTNGRQPLKQVMAFVNGRLCLSIFIMLLAILWLIVNQVFKALKHNHENLLDPKIPILAKYFQTVL